MAAMWTQLKEYMRLIENSSINLAQTYQGLQNQSNQRSKEYDNECKSYDAEHSIVFKKTKDAQETMIKVYCLFLIYLTFLFLFSFIRNEINIIRLLMNGISLMKTGQHFQKNLLEMMLN